MYQGYKNIVQNAINNFNNDDDCKELVLCDISERNLCYKLATFLEAELCKTEFSDYSVNVEYNRGMNGDLKQTKKLDNKPISLDLNIVKILPTPDNGFDNLICIEMKKEKRPSVEIQDDKERLNKLTDITKGYCYKAGFMILVCQNPASNQFGLYIESEYPLH